MQWTKDSLSRLPIKDGFRLRSENMTRLEVFSDTAFAFAMTMLVVSVGSIPQNLPELILALKSVPAFALSFAQISFFWWAHRSWSQRYGLEGRVATLLTLAMIFTVLTYVYPLRLIFSSLCSFLSSGWLPSEFHNESALDVTQLFAIYGVGYAMLTCIMFLLYRDAYNKREELGLSEYEACKTLLLKNVWTHHPVFGILCALTALYTPLNIAVYAGFVLMGVFVTVEIHRRLLVRKYPILARKPAVGS